MLSFEVPNSDAEIKDFRVFLQHELITRCRRNPNYSLRAFARQMDIESSHLSKILHGKRNLSSTTLLKLGTKLDVREDALRRFETHNRFVKKGLVVSTPNAYRELSDESVKLISKWYHYAILELCLVADFQPDYHWIAKRLGLNQKTVQRAIDRLVSFKLLRKRKNGKWKCCGNFTMIRDNYTDHARKNHQRDVLKMANRALDEYSLSARDQSSMTIAVNSENLPEAKERIKQFRRDLTKIMQKGKALDDVYQLSLSLYPATTKKIIQGVK